MTAVDYNLQTVLQWPQQHNDMQSLRKFFFGHRAPPVDAVKGDGSLVRWINLNGMNFVDRDGKTTIPELKWTAGYLYFCIIVIVYLVVAILLAWLFHLRMKRTTTEDRNQFERAKQHRTAAVQNKSDSPTRVAAALSRWSRRGSTPSATARSSGQSRDPTNRSVRWEENSINNTVGLETPLL